MKAIVKETGKEIDVCSLYPVTYSRLDCNGQIREEYDEDELEFPDRPQYISKQKVCTWLAKHYIKNGDDSIIDEALAELKIRYPDECNNGMARCYEKHYDEYFTIIEEIKYKKAEEIFNEM